MSDPTWWYPEEAPEAPQETQARPAYQDPWSGDPDTDKYWAKEA